MVFKIKPVWQFSLRRIDLKGFEISAIVQNLQLDNIDDYNKDVKLEYQLLWKNALATFGGGQNDLLVIKVF